MSGQIKTIKNCPPPSVGSGGPNPEVKVHHIVDALEEISDWVGSIREALQKLPPNTVIPTDPSDHT
ncbi:MAG: hypothetical protein HKN21_03345 [Candidatus Eisenbacteria bacterium]|uniref:Uncharacterized protein n=1 Tax=Eiseniibacteriota bacterium TaxID=2212470 RepID=A0A7Y2ECX1_UNCEI|nr:hypothetical protein [Candidatus Eisenbacteria bacterium]